MYKIRKNSNWQTYGFSWKLLYISIFFIIIGAFALTCLITWNTEDLQWIDLIFVLLVSSTFLIIWITMYIHTSKIYNAKKLKKNWKGFIKKIKISSIERYKTEFNRDSFDWYYLQAIDWDFIYCSDGINKNKVEEVLLNSDLASIYVSYWYEYDDKETYKKEVLNEIDKEINESEHEAQKWRLLQRISAKEDLSNIYHRKKLIETWYQTPYLAVVNWHKVSVWDTVDVYIDPDDEKNYWMDIDFLFNK
jgi:hypothetical protein